MPRKPKQLANAHKCEKQTEISTLILSRIVCRAWCIASLALNPASRIISPGKILCF